MTEQINVFVENKKGRLHAVTHTLAEAGINVRAIVIQDRGEYGMIKILADDPPKAKNALSAHGFTCALKPVLAVVMDDRPGGMDRLTRHLSEQDVNVLDAYGFVVESKKESVICIEVHDPAAARAAIEAGGFKILSDRELYEL